MAMLSSSPVLKFVDEKGFDEKIVTDIAYDYHGRRLATVSADAVIRIRDLDDNGMWCVEDGCEIKSAHQVRRPTALSHLAKRCGPVITQCVVVFENCCTFNIQLLLECM